MSIQCRKSASKVAAMSVVFLALGLCLTLGLSSVAVALDIGGALNKVAKTAEKAANKVENATEGALAPSLPSGASPYLRQADQKLDKMDEIMADTTPDKYAQTRVQNAANCLKAAKEAVATVEKRFGAKMGKDHPELKKRRERIADCEKAFEEFKTAMAAAPAEGATATAPAEASTAAAPAEAAPEAEVPKEAAPASGASAEVPSSAKTFFTQADRKMDRMDEIMGPESAGRNKQDRVSDAEFNLKGAQEAVETVEHRYGKKMGSDHPEIVKRRARIAALEKALETFRTEMADATKAEDEARAAKDQAEADARVAQEKQETADMAQRQKDVLEADRKAREGEIGTGKILFSKSPIDAANPANLTAAFQAGDSIYGLIQVDRTWREIYNAKDASEQGIMIVMATDGDEDYQYITLKKPEYIDSKYLVLDVAPHPGKMTAYKDPAIEFGEGKGNRKIGPIAFTYDLAQLSPGKHTVKFYIRDFGKKHATGQFDIEGADFKFYADLHEKVKGASDAVATMPPAGMVNKSLEEEMRALLANAGWSNILRLAIVDKDWWIDYYGETGSGVKSRHMDAAAAAKGDDGKCYYCICQFHQPMLIDGSWGKLELTNTGRKRDIAEENIDK